MPAIFVSGVNPVTWPKTLEPSIQKFTIAAAEFALRDAVAHGFDPSPVLVTDNVRGRDYEQVKPFGKIEFIANADMIEAVNFALGELIRRAPVRSGRYRDSFIVMVNRVEQTDRSQLSNLKPDDRVQIVNFQPYAKKLEGQKANRKAKMKRTKGSSAKAPGGIFTPVQRAVVAKYGKSLFIDFVYLPLNLGGQTWRRKNRRGQRLNNAQRVAAVYPVLQFYIKPTIN